VFLAEDVGVLQRGGVAFHAGPCGDRNRSDCHRHDHNAAHVRLWVALSRPVHRGKGKENT
jgi:hypothetical protein